MSIKAVLFDLDGTLLDRDTSLFLFVCDQYDRYSQFQIFDKNVFVQRFIDLDNHGYVWKNKVYQQLIDEFSISGVEWTELLNDYLHGFQKHCVGFPNLINMLTRLRNSGVKIALISNGYGQFQYDNFKSLDISHLFDEVLISEWEGFRKPDPAIFIRALSKLGVEATEALFVGDHPENDIRASRAVGMKAAWKRNNTVYSDNVDADVIIDDLGELPQYVLS
ncbi:L-2-haloalkanoic acid dehalogenase [Paenibacillus elgii]|uniref:L-2-haloalkanoic acid dehalogenase n=1 Tax=Paenibacillus elgii TaxID=189691 RepID=A0A2T6G5N4_9BACL|nr:HAD family hydrolase [Paenibacillus elgii]PUA39469.1 L-2-haloalkanoic acid dehalogenase [Paenibacillus elgii]